MIALLPDDTIDVSSCTPGRPPGSPLRQGSALRLPCGATAGVRLYGRGPALRLPMCGRMNNMV